MLCATSLAVPISNRSTLQGEHDITAYLQDSDSDSADHANPTANYQQHIDVPRAVGSCAPSKQQINQLRNNLDNKYNLLFAYADQLEMLDYNDDDCDSVVAQLSSQSRSFPNDTLNCPYKFTCRFDRYRYPRYVISAKCVSRTGLSGVPCRDKGSERLTVLKPHNDDLGCWNGNGDVTWVTTSGSTTRVSFGCIIEN